MYSVYVASLYFVHGLPCSAASWPGVELLRYAVAADWRRSVLCIQPAGDDTLRSCPSRKTYMSKARVSRRRPGNVSGTAGTAGQNAPADRASGSADRAYSERPLPPRPRHEPPVHVKPDRSSTSTHPPSETYTDHSSGRTAQLSVGFPSPRPGPGPGSGPGPGPGHRVLPTLATGRPTLFGRGQEGEGGSLRTKRTIEPSQPGQTAILGMQPSTTTCTCLTFSSAAEYMNARNANHGPSRPVRAWSLQRTMTDQPGPGSRCSH